MNAETPSLGAQLDLITTDLDTTGAAWVAAGYPYDGPVWEAREAVFARLREWNALTARTCSSGSAR